MQYKVSCGLLKWNFRLQPARAITSFSRFSARETNTSERERFLWNRNNILALWPLNIARIAYIAAHQTSYIFPWQRCERKLYISIFFFAAHIKLCMYMKNCCVWWLVLCDVILFLARRVQVYLYIYTLISKKWAQQTSTRDNSGIRLGCNITHAHTHTSTCCCFFFLKPHFFFATKRELFL